MPFDEGLAQRVREVLSDQETGERKMFGGLTFMVRGHMCVGVVGDELMVRVGPAQNDEALGQPHARPMDFTGKPMDGFVYASAKGLESDDDLNAWVGRGLKFNSTLPAK